MSSGMRCLSVYLIFKEVLVGGEIDHSAIPQLMGSSVVCKLSAMEYPNRLLLGAIAASLVIQRVQAEPPQSYL
ncbi:hypothetical protein F1880_001248 [Penicillium rolfsii]|nr:hypothetical protein F1880_001248 [Penicillium rolfsii]